MCHNVVHNAVYIMFQWWIGNTNGVRPSSLYTIQEVECQLSSIVLGISTSLTAHCIFLQHACAWWVLGRPGTETTCIYMRTHPSTTTTTRVIYKHTPSYTCSISHSTCCSSIATAFHISYIISHHDHVSRLQAPLPADVEHSCWIGFTWLKLSSYQLQEHNYDTEWKKICIGCKNMAGRLLAYK